MPPPSLHCVDCARAPKQEEPEELSTDDHEPQIRNPSEQPVKEDADVNGRIYEQPSVSRIVAAGDGALSASKEQSDRAKAEFMKKRGMSVQFAI